MAHISTINTSLNTVRSKLGGGANGLFWEKKAKFTDKSKLLYSYNDGYLDTPSTSIDYINGLQAKIGAVDENIPNEYKELRSSVTRFYGANIANIEGGSNPSSSLNGRGLIIGGRVMDTSQTVAR